MTHAPSAQSPSGAYKKTRRLYFFPNPFHRDPPKKTQLPERRVSPPKSSPQTISHSNPSHGLTSKRHRLSTGASRGAPVDNELFLNEVNDEDHDHDDDDLDDDDDDDDEYVVGSYSNWSGEKQYQIKKSYHF